MNIGLGRSRVDGARTDEAAAYWFALLQSPRAKARDWRAFEAWQSQSPANAAAYEKLGLLWQQVEGAAETQEVRAMRRTASTGRARHRSYLSIAVAASLLAIVAALLWIVQPRGFHAFVASLQHGFIAGPDHGRFVTAIGERSIIGLSDGSVVTLDTDSEVNVDFSRSERTIYLTRGQAMFEVAHDKKHPFAVHAGDRCVIATGTAFTVRLDAADVSVALVEGNVVVEQLPETKGAALNVEATLQPGERLIAKTGAAASVTTTNIEQATSWRLGKVVFLDTPLSVAVKELNRYSDDKIVLVNDAFATLHINGVFRTGQPLDFARAVASLYPFSIDTQHPGEIRLTARATN
jgi:transmembrane sensor